MERIGVFLCRGCGISTALDCDNLAQEVRGPGVCGVSVHPMLCSDAGIASITSGIEGGALDGVVIGACSSREKVAAFAGLQQKVALQRVNFREQVAWTHQAGSEDTFFMAADALKMGIAAVRTIRHASVVGIEVSRSVLVVGGGLCGLVAADAAAGMGYDVVLVEKAAILGGHLRCTPVVPPFVAPFDAPVENPLWGWIQRVTENPRIRVCTSTSILSISGQPGQFVVQTGEETFSVGAIVQATGATPLPRNELRGVYDGAKGNVITSADLDDMLNRQGVQCPLDGRPPQTVLFIQCAGSRDAKGLPYCSKECCQDTLRQIHQLRAQSPDVQILVLYRDMRTSGRMEQFYEATQLLDDVSFIRGEAGRIESARGRLNVLVQGSLLGTNFLLEVDLVVAAVGMVPVSEALHLAYRQGADLPQLVYRFVDSHFICFPYETRRTGIYAAGTVRAPMDIAAGIADARGAALQAVQSIEAAAAGRAMLPRLGDVDCPEYFMQRCTQCKRCTEECPYGALNEDEKGTPAHHPARCRKCGICLGACPERIVSFGALSVTGVAAMIQSIEVPDEFEEKPRILVFLCENDAAPALDAAARLQLPISPWVRFIEIRCLGAFHNVWAAEALSCGFDGVLLMGCKQEGDYQCHNIHGSMLAHTRMANMGETLSRLALEPERVKVVEVGRDDFFLVCELINDFADALDVLGPNPLKGV